MPESTSSSILFELSDQTGFVEVGLDDRLAQLEDYSEQALNMALGTVQTMARRLAKTIHALEREAMPDAVEVEFGVKLEVEGGAIVPLVAKTAAAGQLNVRFKWTIERPAAPPTVMTASA